VSRRRTGIETNSIRRGEIFNPAKVFP